VTNLIPFANTSTGNTCVSTSHLLQWGTLYALCGCMW